jgi:phosphoribosylformylglycinamidine synthase PurS subunit
MKATVTITLKPSILDPQGQSIAKALQSMGFTDVQDARMGKVIELTLKDGVDPASAKAKLEKAASELLANPVMETFKVSV